VMSLYIHVANKDEIITAAAELVLAGMSHANKKAKPRNAIVRYFEGFRQELVAHPSVAQAIASTPIAGPAVFNSMDSLFAVFARAGLDDDSAVAAVTGLMSYTLGFVFFSTARTRDDPSAAGARARNLRGVDPDAFPHLHRVRELLVGDAFDRQFSTGLSLLVDAYLLDAE
jgi:AcrR family transcriptional regulator